MGVNLKGRWSVGGGCVRMWEGGNGGMGKSDCVSMGGLGMGVLWKCVVLSPIYFIVI